jgi:hypothetical protein
MHREVVTLHTLLAQALVLAMAALAGGCNANAQNARPSTAKPSVVKPGAAKPDSHKPAAVSTRIVAPIATSPVPSPDPALPRAGINLNGPADWNSELPFVDVFRLSREWISQKKGEAWGKGPQLKLDERGWVQKLEPDTWAETPMNTVKHAPAGRYTVFYKGKGQLDVGGDGRKIEEAAGKMVFEAQGSGSIFLRLVATDPTDYVRDIRVVMPGFEQSYEKQVFHPIFLQRWRGMTVLRFMDWMNTNNSKQQKWADRPKVENATWTRDGGIPLEVMIDLSNRLGADPWFCMPHLADDDYVRNFATLVKNRLHPARRVYIEYSNELWNGQFEQSRWAGQKGMELKLGDKPWEAGWHYTARRSVQIFKIWDGAFGGREAASKRLVRVLGSQSANVYVSEQILQFEDAYKSADALAIAPYLSFNVPQQGDGLTAATVSTWSVNQVLDHLEQKALPETVKWIVDNKKVADKYGVKMIAYEAGQHAVGIQGGENNEALTQLFHEANRSARMGELYTKYLNAWKDNGGGLICMFASVGEWSKWGSWGLMQSYHDKPADYPKFAATLNWAKAQSQPVSLK